MHEKITKENIDEYITSYIDGQIGNPIIEKQIYDMLSGDVVLLKKYQSESLTKNILQNRLKMQDVPGPVYTGITTSIDNIITNSIENRPVTFDNHPINSSRSFPEYLRKVITAPFVIGRLAVPGYVFAVLFVIIILTAGLLINKKSANQLNPYIVDGSDKSIMVQAANNFHKILKGEMMSQVSSKDENDLKKYLRDNLDYDIYFPCIENCESISVAYNEYNGQKIAHIIYRSGNDLFYICETPSKSLNNKCMEIPEQVHNEIIEKKYYICDKIDDNNDCTMLLWYTGNIVCASVSTMPKQKMYATFTNFK